MDLKQGSKMELDLDINHTNELKALGINVVDQLSLEQNVASEVDEAVKKQNRKQKMHILSRELKESKLEIIKLKNKEADFEHRLSGMRQRFTDPRQYIAVEKSCKENLEQLRAIFKRKEYVEERLKAASEDASVLDDVDLNLEDGEVMEEDEETVESKISALNRDTLIKEGKMTPFGTLLNAMETREDVSFVKPTFLESSGSPLHRKSKSLKSTSSHDEVLSLNTPSAHQKSHKPSENKPISTFEKYLQDQINKQKSCGKETSNQMKRKTLDDSKNCNFKRPKMKIKEFTGTDSSESTNTNEGTNTKKGRSKSSPLKKRILKPKKHWKERNLGTTTSELEVDQYKTPAGILSEKVAFVTSEDEKQGSDSDYIPSDDEFLSEEESQRNNQSKDADFTKISKTENRKKIKSEKKIEKSKRVMDDGYIENYTNRIKEWKNERLKEKHQKILDGEDVDSDEDNEYERFDGDYKIPLSLWNKLYKYQKTCVKWLWELHCQQCGGILGDEMGLGKTIMVISFLVGLSYSGLLDRDRKHRGLGPVLIVAPATVLHQWVREFHKWWPPFRVAVLHESGVFRGKKSALIHNVNNHDGILITSYRGVVDHLKVLLNYNWHYVILDEGHKIRNPEAQITMAVKRFETTHRIILSGSPIQNGLKELWSLFDFIFPGKLGSQQVFLQQFAVPITQGGYANASKLEVQTAFKCATVLRDTINPYLLRRMKIDVKNHLSLPDKNEQVLFCGLTDEQRALYKGYIDGNEVKSIMNGRLQVFVGLINLRKICNHPDIYDGGPKHFVNEDISNLEPEFLYGWWKRSGKMVVLHAILKLWKKQDHKVLLFTQSRQMLCILEKFLMEGNYEYLKMDGGTSVGSRQSIIDRFNKDPDIFVFLLTTRVGGLGVNLTGADRVIIFDPDWNPSTDTQARERAWRIGQTRNVTIYRLLTAGTIEEKIYHRQIFKQFLTNRVLKDPKQQRFFKTNDLHELFTLNEGEKEKTESAAIFAGTGSEIIIKNKGKTTEKKDSQLIDMKTKTKNDPVEPILKDSKLIKMKNETKKGSVESKLKDSKLVNMKSKSKKDSIESSMNNRRNENLVKDSKVLDYNSSNNNYIHSDIKEQCQVNASNCADYTEPSNDDNVISHLLEKTCSTNFPPEDTILESENIIDNENKDLIKEETISNNDSTNEANVVLENSDIIKCSDTEKKPLGNDEEAKKKERMMALAKLLSKRIVENKNVKQDEVCVDEGKSSSKSRLSKKKNKKDKEKGKKKKRVDGERIDNLVKKRRYKFSEDLNEDKIQTSKAQDDFVLQKLFKSSGVHTALSHDVILNSGDPDYLLLESEAEKVAKEALKQIRLSRSQCFQARKNKTDEKLRKEKSLPRFGSKRSQLVSVDPKEKKRNSTKSTMNSQPKMFNGGIEDEEDEKIPIENTKNPPPDSPKKQLDEGASSGVLSSAQLLKRMRERNRVTTVSSNPPAVSNENGDPTSDPPMVIEGSYDPDYPSTAVLETQSFEIDPEIQEHVDVLSDIRNFIAFQSVTDGRASTDEVVQRFKDKVPNNQNHIFRALLNQICDFVRDSTGQGFWYIKEEFR